MGNPIHVLAQQLTGKPTVEDCSLDEVKRLVQRYPYFAPAQFLLLQKLRQSGPVEEAGVQYKKAVLFYPNPLAFELFISSGRFFDGEAAEPVTESTEGIVYVNETIQDNTPVEESFVTGVGATPIDTEDILPADDLPALPESREAIAGPAGALQSPAVAAVIEGDPGRETGTKQPNADSPTPLKDVPEASTALNDQRTGAATSEPLIFEPYHTVDYFASQGIKITQDELPKDRLGKQLKSFTEWLRTMKRLPAPQATGSGESLAEKGVEGMADRSVSESEVLTEAMAEVWAKQGVPQKALDIYNKLSLHNPSKRDYFAAKIEI